jgi:hypothetical protein
MAAHGSLAASKTTRKAGVYSSDAINGSEAQLAERQREAAQYIGDMILELRNMAKANRLFQVLVPLEYAYYEAFAVANKVEPPPEEVERLKVLSKVSNSLESEVQDY